MIPVRLVAEASSVRPLSESPNAASDVDGSENGGACMMDATGDGPMDLVLMQSGPEAIRVLQRKSWKLRRLGCPGGRSQGLGTGHRMRGGRLRRRRFERPRSSAR